MAAQRHNISKTIKLFFFEGLALIPVLFSMLMFSWKILVVTLVMSSVLIVFGFYGYPPKILARRIRTIIAGPVKSIRSRGRSNL